MKIRESNATNPSNSSNVSRLQNRGVAPTGGGSAGQAGGAPEGADNVQVSTLSHQLNTSESQSASNVSKLVELSGAVSSGRYQVDAHVLSNDLIQEHMRTAA
jgi:anti-sigma28 factor (negative regulator of flagellin synthesis)